MAYFSFGLKETPDRKNTTISKNRAWREVATVFLGDRLTPTLQSSAPDPAAQLDQEWNDWYNILQDYVLRGVPPVPPQTQGLMNIIHATTWALFILLIISGVRATWVVLFFSLVLFPCALTLFFSTWVYQKADRLTFPDFTARLLAETRKREDVGNRKV